MATILRGKHRGEEIAIHQWCNDWFTLEDAESRVVSPLSLQLNEDEIKRVRRSFVDGRAGIMPRLYDLNDDGTFTKRRIPG